MLIGQLGGYAVYGLEATRVVDSVLPLDVLAIGTAFLMYAIALFGFRILDLIALARRTLIEQMPDAAPHIAAIVALDPLQAPELDPLPGQDRALGRCRQRAPGRRAESTP